MPGQHNKRKYPKSDANFASSGKSEKQFPKSQRVLAFVTLQITVVLGRTQIRLNVPLKGLLINLKKSIRYNTIKNLFCTNRVHLELARGSDLDNQKYCSKENNFFEFGQPAARKPEKRKLEDAIDSIRQSKDMRTIANEFDEIYVRHWRGLEKLQSMINPPPERDYKTQVFYYHGPPGTGKSKTAYDEAKATVFQQLAKFASLFGYFRIFSMRVKVYPKFNIADKDQAVGTYIVCPWHRFFDLKDREGIAGDDFLDHRGARAYRFYQKAICHTVPAVTYNYMVEPSGSCKAIRYRPWIKIDVDGTKVQHCGVLLAFPSDSVSHEYMAEITYYVQLRGHQV
nr:replication association protein [Hymenolepis microstoma]